MKNIFSRIMALALALVMLLGMTASAEPVAVTKAGAVINWLGDISQAFLAQTTDEDGCARIDFSSAVNGEELISGFLQIGEALTIGSGEEAYTITPEAIEAFAALVEAMVADEEGGSEYASYIEIAAIAQAYMDSEVFPADVEILSNVLMSEINRLAQVAFALGYVTQDEDGTLRVELNDTALVTLIASYLIGLSNDTNVMAAVSSLGLWAFVGKADEAEALVKQAFAEIAEMGQSLMAMAPEMDDTMTLTAVIGASGLHVEYTSPTAHAVANYDGAIVALSYDEEKYDGEYSIHMTATITVDGRVELSIAGKDFSDEIELELLISDEAVQGRVKTANSYSGAEEIAAAFSDEGVSLSYTESADDVIYTNFAVKADASGLALNYADQNRYIEDNNTVAQLIVDANGAKFDCTAASYGTISTCAATFDPATMAFDLQADSTDGDILVISANPSLFVLTFGDTYNVLNVNALAVSETEWTMNGTITSYDETIATATGAIDLANGTFNMEADINEDGETAHVVITANFDCETLSFAVNADITVGEMTLSLTGEGAPVITEDMFAYNLKATMDGEEIENILFGLRLMASDDPEAIHGELFVELKEMDPSDPEGATEESLALEFVVKQGNPMGIQLILKVDGEAIGSLSGEAETALEEAPAHVEGYQLTGEELFEIFTSLMSGIVAG